MKTFREGEKYNTLLNIFIAEPDAFSKTNPAEINHYDRRNDILRLLIANKRVSEPLHKTEKKKVGNTKTSANKKPRAMFPAT